MSAFLDINQYPRAWALAAELQLRAEAILVEGADAVEKGLFTEWPEPINLGGWLTFGLKWQGQMLDHWPQFTAGRFAAMAEGLVINCGYSLMMPGAEIAPHVGYTSDVLRLHLGLSVPEGDCALIVGDERREWAQGDVLLFDDTVAHSAHNKTEGPRLILLVDVLKARAGE